MLKDIDTKHVFLFIAPKPQRELPILAELAGIVADPTVYRIVIELLSMQIEPEVVYKLLRSIRRAAKSSSKQSSSRSSIHQ